MTDPTGPGGDGTGAREDRLADLREKISDVDRGLLELLRRRMDLAAEVGRVKALDGRPILVPEVHDRVLGRARRHAEACGVSDTVMESIFDAVMRGSVERQHRVGVALHSAQGDRILVVGGAGAMGEWWTRFLSLLGHRVEIVDPSLAKLPSSEGRWADLADVPDLDAYSALLVSVPLGRSPEILDDLVARRPRGRILEIASIKDHLREALDRASEAGVEVSSLHPMFGPGKSPYEPLTFVLACRDDPARERDLVESWLRHPYTRLVTVPFSHHDRLMGWLLGLAHLSGMVFGLALSDSGLGAGELAACASTTFDRQVSTARSVLLEDPDLYFDIQGLNPHRGEVYRATRQALDLLVAAVEGERREEFREILGRARAIMER